MNVKIVVNKVQVPPALCSSGLNKNKHAHIRPMSYIHVHHFSYDDKKQIDETLGVIDIINP